MAFVAVNADLCGSSRTRDGCDLFVRSIAGARGLLIIFLCYICYYNPGLRAAEATRLVPHALVVILWLINSVVPDGSDCPEVNISSCWAPYIATWNGAIVVDFLSLCSPVFLPWLGRGSWLHGDIPLNLPLLVERHRLFLVISLGEVCARQLPISNHACNVGLHVPSIAFQ